MKRNMWKIAEGTEIPTAYDMTYGEIVQLKERYESGERDAKFEALLTAFRYGFACAQRMEVNKRKRGGSEMTADEQILNRGQDCIPYDDFWNLKEQIIQKYYFSSPTFWMWKALQFGYVYGKRAERARRKKRA